jgi:predicted dehydrogenase/nucleoside-diphosphate-sugar epimerase
LKRDRIDETQATDSDEVSHGARRRRRHARFAACSDLWSTSQDIERRAGRLRRFLDWAIFMTVALRVAILGGGRMAQKHATAIRLQPGTQLAAVVDPHLGADEIRARFGGDVETFSDARQMLERTKPDIVHIVTPPSTHFALAKLCLEHGANVYVEKPFAATTDEAANVLALARERGLKVCAAHQVLFQRAGQLYQTYLPTIGDLVHIESYFSFKPVRRRPDGGTPLSAVDQLIDILPHPVYLLLSALERTGGTPEVTALDVSPSGEVRAVIRCGRTLATLNVTLQGRPVESYLRVVGTNGSITADFILGDVVTSLGPGASAPAVVIKPFSQSWQKFWGSFAGLARLLFRRQKSYPGLGELLDLFYSSVRSGSPSPIADDVILATVGICETIATRLAAAEDEAERAAREVLAARARDLPPVDPTRGIVLVTGGSGFLGRPVLAHLRASGWHVRALVRRTPAFRQQAPGIEYAQGDLAREVSPETLAGVTLVVHLAAETAGDRAAHERNTVIATRNLLDAMARAKVARLINISSVAVMRPGPAILSESSPIDRGNLSRGPYVWAKAEAEALAVERTASEGLDVKTVRLGPLVDFGDFTAPGRLGRDVGRLFVTMGTPSSPLSVCDVHTAAKVIGHYANAFSTAPRLVNLLEVPAITRGDLAARLRKTRPELRFLWLPFPVVRFLSLVATGLQKVLRPGRPALDVYSAFKSERYDSSIAQQVINAAEG